MEMDQQRRLFLAMAIMIPLAFLFSWYTQQQMAPAAQAAADAGTQAATAQAPTPAAGTPTEVKPPVPGVPAQPEEPAAEVKQLTVQRDDATLTFSTRGAGLVSAKLKGDKTREQTRLSPWEGFKRVFTGTREEAPPMDLAVPPDAAAGDMPLAVAIRGPRAVAPGAVYRVSEEKDGLRFTLRQAGYEIEKELRWPTGPYDFTMTVKVKNVAAEEAKGDLQVSYSRGINPDLEEAGSFFGGVGNQSNVACLVDDDLTRLRPNDKPPEVKTGKVSFFAIDQQYFAGALYPLEGPLDGKCEALANKTVRRASAFFPLELKPGEERVFRFGGYIGPKDVDILGHASEHMASLGVKPAEAARFGGTPYPHLDKLVDYSVWAVICRVLLGVLKFFYSLTHNWGVAIILLTLMVKLALVPLSVKQMAGMEAMKKLQPKMDEIRKKYAEDRERQQVETLKLYQEAKVNPAAGCFPMLVQVPIWIALFTTLRTSYELYRASFISPVWTDLTFRDPTYLLPIAMGITWIFTQRSQPQMVDPMQAKLMTYVMPSLFTVAMLNYPMGLSLYIATNNVLTQVQQFVLKKYMAQKGGGADTAAGAKKPGEKNERDAGKPGRRRQRAT
ncbi:MAG TPA: membrane protein insertase YidC [Myxococcales bacterium]|nr:membrane protein insertase YidC [Myxococcales bacterium]